MDPAHYAGTGRASSKQVFALQEGENGQVCQAQNEPWTKACQRVWCAEGMRTLQHDQTFDLGPCALWGVTEPYRKAKELLTFWGGDPGAVN